MTVSDIITLLSPCKTKDYYKNPYDFKPEPVFSSKILIKRRFISLITIIIMAPIHLALWIPIFCILWIPYCLYQVFHWLAKGNIKEFSMKIKRYRSIRSTGVFYWYRWALLDEIYCKIIEWSKGKSKTDYIIAEKMYERDWAIKMAEEKERKEKIEIEKEIERKGAPYMEELNKIAPGIKA